MTTSEYLPVQDSSNPPPTAAPTRRKSKRKPSRRSRSRKPRMDGDRTWFKAIRTNDAMEMIEANKNAFILLYAIAYRAQRTDAFNAHGLKPGQAFLGDYERIGLTQGEYRIAKDHLTLWGFATFDGTNKGTIATLIKSTIFDINIELHSEQNNERGANEVRTNNEQGTNEQRLPRMLNNANNAKQCEETVQHSKNPSSTSWEERE